MAKKQYTININPIKGVSVTLQSDDLEAITAIAKEIENLDEPEQLEGRPKFVYTKTP